LSSDADRRRRRLRSALVVLAGIYLTAIWLDGVGTRLPSRFLPSPLLFFVAYTALFPNAATAAIDYRAEGYSCKDHQWTELDVMPWFPVDADNKESRFHRALQMYRKDRKVMRALEEYVIRRNNDSSSRSPIVGVRFSSIRAPLPAVGSHVDASGFRPLASYPESQKHAWYYTPASKRRERCGDPKPPPSASASDPTEESFSGKPPSGAEPGEPQP
jgi:hypothetical protein